MKPGDVIEWTDGKTRHQWRVRGIYLGAVGQESVIEVENVSHSPAWSGPWETHVMMFIPECLLRQCRILPPMASREMIERREQICYDTAMSQWERSLKRPDLTEEDRIKGAILAYQRQAFAFALDAALAPGEDVGGVVERLREAAVEIRNDGTPSQVGLGEDKCLSTADLIEAQAAQIASLSAKVAEVEVERDANHNLAVANGQRAKEEDARASELQREVERLEKALRRIAEGNLGDASWEADYEKIRQVARAALQQEGE